MPTSIQEAIRKEVQSSSTWLGSEISRERRDAMERYLGEPYGNELEGRSQVISSDVQDVIESILPDFMEIFASGDRIAAFEPHGEEDKEVAEQASDYVNYVWNVDNPGFEITYDWVKDALLLKNGFIKTYWDDSATAVEETYENLDEMQLGLLVEDPEVEVLEQDQSEGGFTVKVKRIHKRGRVKIEVVPPEEMIIARWSRSLYDTSMVCHKTEKTVTELIQMGFDPKHLEDIPSDDEQLFNEERIARYENEEFPDDTGSYQEAMRKIWLYEVYIRYDDDGDGMAEWRQVFCAGSNYEVLKFSDGSEANTRVDDHIFDTITPIRMPHRTFGRSVADLVSDVQLIKTTIQRQLLDNMYFTNNARNLVNEDVNLDDLLTNRPGGAVRVRGSINPGQAVFPLTTPPLGPHAFPLLEYWDSVREMRTGITRYNQGMDANSLNDTASGINMILGRAQQRTMLIARLFAETGFKRVMMRILNLLVTHQDRPRTIRLRNKWVEMDPRAWNTNMDVTVQVGIGQGTAQNKQATLMAVLSIQEKAIQFQGGVDGPLVNLSKIFNTVDQLAKASGFRNGDMFFLDPSTPEMQQLYQQMKQNQQPPPEMVKIEKEHEREVQRMQLTHQENIARLEHDVQRAQADLGFKYQQHADESEIRKAELYLREVELELEAAKEGQKIDIERQAKETDGKVKIGSLNQSLLEKNPEAISTSLIDAAEKLERLAGPITEAADRLTGSKEFIYDARGNVTAVRHSDGTVQPVLRDADGTMKGLGSIQ